MSVNVTPQNLSSQSMKPPIVPRALGLEFDPDQIPKWWFYQNPIITHVANGLHLVFPAGERFFIRSVKAYLDQIDDPELIDRVRAFFQQEAHHGHEHAESFKMLEAQGYDVRGFLDFYEKEALPFLEQSFPPILRLSATVALEHLTATLGEAALTDGFLDGAHPKMRTLLRWHAAEEIEHKSVAFDVLEAVNPNYFVRLTGMGLGLLGLLYFWRQSTRRLMRQEQIDADAWVRYRTEARELAKNRTRKTLWHAFRGYLKPNFHPDDHDNYRFAEQYLKSIGRWAA